MLKSIQEATASSGRGKRSTDESDEAGKKKKDETLLTVNGNSPSQLLQIANGYTRREEPQGPNKTHKIK